MITYNTYGLALPGKVYSPSLTATVTAGGSDTITFRGRDALAYGVTGIYVQSDQADDVTYTAELEDGDKTLFRTISERTLRDFAENGMMPSPIIIPKKRDLTFTIANGAGSDAAVRIMLQGFVESQLAVIQAQQRKHFGFVPEIRFIYGSVETDDGDVFQPMDVTVPPGNWAFDRVAVGVRANSAANRSGTIFRFRSGDYTVKQPASILQLRTQFRYGGHEGLHYIVDDFDPFDVEVSNDSGNTNTADILIPVIPAEALASHNDRERIAAQF